MSSFNRDQTQKTDDSSQHTATEQQEKECYFDYFDTTMKFTVNCELGNLIYTPLAISFAIPAPHDRHLASEMIFINLLQIQDTRLKINCNRVEQTKLEK